MCVYVCVLACKKKADCAHVLPPLSEQKVISQPSPDENALSISLNTLPGKKNISTYRMRNKLEQQKNSPQTVFH